MATDLITLVVNSNDTDRRVTNAIVPANGSGTIGGPRPNSVQFTVIIDGSGRVTTSVVKPFP